MWQSSCPDPLLESQWNHGTLTNPHPTHPASCSQNRLSTSGKGQGKDKVGVGSHCKALGLPCFGPENKTLSNAFFRALIPMGVRTSCFILLAPFKQQSTTRAETHPRPSGSSPRDPALSESFSWEDASLESPCRRPEGSQPSARRLRF